MFDPTLLRPPTLGATLRAIARAGRSGARALALAAVLWLAAGALAGHVLAAPPDGPTLEEAGWLERWQGDLDGAEKIYRALTSKGADAPPEVRAEALFRLGALLVRRGSPEGERVFRALAKDHPDRKDLLARADLVLVPAAERLPPEGAETQPGLRAKIIACRTGGLFTFRLGTRDGLETGRRCVVLRGPSAVGVAIVIRLTEGLAAAKLETGEAVEGDVVEARARSEAPGSPAAPPGAPAAPRAPPRAPGASASASEGESVEAARLFLDAIAATIGPRGPDRDHPETGTPSAQTEVQIEARAIGVDEAFIERLPFAFERSAPGRLEAGAPLADEGALVARLDTEQERVLVERVLRAGAPREAAGPPSLEGEARVHRAKSVGIRAGKRVEITFAASGAGFTGLRLGLRLVGEPRRRPGALLIDEADVEVDLVVVDRPPEPVIFPGKEGPIALSPPTSQRARPVVRLSRDRPAVVIAGLEDPFAPAGARRELLLTLTLSRGPAPGGLDR